jgi:hypothetical protein
MKNGIAINLLLVLILIGGPSLSAAQPEIRTTSQGPVLLLSEETLRVQSIASGATVILFSVAREPAGGIARVVSRHERLIDDDADGEIVYEPEAGLVPHSIWMVIEFATGAIAAGGGGGMPPSLMHRSGAGEPVPAQVGSAVLAVGREQVDILVVRPGEGAWARVVRDGGDADADGNADGVLTLDPSKLRPVDETFDPAPAALLPGDVVAVLDAARLEYWYETIAGGGQ